MRYWLPLVAALACLFAATKTSAIVGLVLIIVAFGLVIEVGDEAVRERRQAGGLSDHRQ